MSLGSTFYLYPPDSVSFDDAHALFREGARPPEEELHIEKNWDLIHFLLYGTKERVGAPTYEAILGGLPIPEVSEHVQVIPAREVTAIAKHLNTISVVELLSRFDPGLLDAAGVYQGPWVPVSPFMMNEIEVYYPLVRDLYDKASKMGYVVMVTIV